MTVKKPKEGIILNPVNLIPRILSSQYDYVTIKDGSSPLDSLEVNQTIINVNDSLRQSNSSKYKTFATVGILVSSLVFVLGILFLGDSTSSRLGQSLNRITSFRQVVHPELPTSLWGSVVKPYPTGAFWTNLGG